MLNIPYLLILSFAVVFGTSLTVFALYPDNPELLAFSGETFLSGEVWRLATFPFTHINLAHLLENLIALIIITIFGYQVGLSGRQFIACFLGASLVIAIVEAPIVPTLLIAGASVGVLAISGFVSFRGKRFIPPFILIPILLLPIILQFVLNYLRQGPNYLLTAGLILHLAGFAIGIAIFFSFRFFKKDRSILHSAHS